MPGETTTIFALEIARAVLAKAEADSQRKNLTQQYTADQLIEIERRISAMRECMASIGPKPRLS
jgi:hypothetical protein